MVFIVINLVFSLWSESKNWGGMLQTWYLPLFKMIKSYGEFALRIINDALSSPLKTIKDQRQIDFIGYYVTSSSLLHGRNNFGDHRGNTIK